MATDNKPPYEGTRLRPVRVDDDLWEAAKAEAALRGESVSVAIRRFLSGYSKGRGRPKPKPKPVD